MTKPRLKTFTIVIHEVLVHTTEVEARSEADAIRKGTAAWDTGATHEFSSDTLGRNQYISATEFIRAAEVQS